MPAIYVHVRPPHRHPGLLLLSAVYGLCTGSGFVLLMWAAESWLMQLFKVVPVLEPGVVAAILFVLPLFVAAAYMARCCQHNKIVYWSGQLVTSAHFCGAIGVLCAIQGGPPEWWAYLIMAGVVVVAGMLFGGVGLLFNALHVHHISRLLEQDGSLCPCCGYVVSQVDSTVCQECGAARDTPTTPLGWIYEIGEFLDRYRRSGLQVVVAIVLLVSALFVWHQLPRWQFISKFKEPDALPMTFSGGGHSGIELHRGIPDDPQGRCLIISLQRDGWFSAGRVHLRIGQRMAVTARPDGTSLFMAYDGLPRVVCYLDDQQRAAVLDRGVPEALIQAMMKAADAAGWRPRTAGPGGAAVADVVVGADAHFPPATAPSTLP